MKSLTCLIADDEPIARQILQSYIEQVPNLTLMATCKDAFEVMETLQTEQIDLIFLDINMPKLSGLSLLRTLSKKPEVIITTAYSEHAIEGFELSVTDYLLKPFSLERFLQAVMKVRKNLQAPPALKTDSLQAETQSESAAYIFIKTDKKTQRVNFKDILYLEAYGNYVKVHLQEETLLTAQTLTDLSAKMPQPSFVKTHKSYVINFDKIKALEGNTIELVNEVKLAVGKTFQKEIKGRIL